MSSFTKPKLIPLLISLVGFVTMMSLGTWQSKRLIWKEELIDRIATANEQTPLKALPSPEEVLDKRFYKVELQGTYLDNYQFHIAARYFRGQLGYHILIPFQPETGEIVLVNHGWIPAKKKDEITLDLPGTHSITAQIRTSNERNPFTPINQVEKNIWFGRDAVEMGQSISLDVLPYTIDIIGEQNLEKLPIPSNGTIKLRNDHLGYAITWFSIGAAILVIFLLYHRKKPEEQ